MDNNNSFGKKLKQVRKLKGLTQEKLAELVDVHEKHISKLETGYYKPNLTTLNKILKVLDVTAQELGFNFENISENDNPFYIKSMQILNNATEQELEYYYGILKQAQKGLDLIRS